MADARLGGLVDDPRRNAMLGWLVTAVLAVLAVANALSGSYRWFVFTGFAIAIVLAPVVAFRDPFAMPPWELLLFVLVPVVDATILGGSVLTSVTVYVAVATIALLVAVEIDRFTAVRMNHGFAIAFVVLATLAVAGAWNVALWVSDVTFGTAYILGDRSQDAANRAMMYDFGYAALAGLLAGIVFDRYVRSGAGLRPDRSLGPQRSGSETGSQRSAADSGSRTSAPDPNSDSDPVPSLVRRLDVPERTVRRASRVMQAILAVILVYGLVSRDLTTIANAGIALAITFLPAILERDYRLPLEPELVFWLTAAVFLHALGSAGFYEFIGQWDSLTHTISATIVAAAGYAVVRAIDLHTDEVYFPTPMLVAFILVFVLAFGVLWELFEFGIDESAQVLGIDAVVAQYGLSDTIVDLVYDVFGAVVAAIWGSIYLTDLTHRIADRIEG